MESLLIASLWRIFFLREISIRLSCQAKDRGKHIISLSSVNIFSVRKQEYALNPEVKKKVERERYASQPHTKCTKERERGMPLNLSLKVLEREREICLST